MRDKNRFRVLQFFLLPAALLTAQLSFSQTNPLWREGESGPVDPSLEQLGRAFSLLAEKVQPAVVQIRAARAGSSDGGGESRTPSASRGSGFIINSEGYVITAHHVIDGAKEIEVHLHDRRRFRAQMVASEPQVDVALLRIRGDGLPILALGNSDRLRVGELVASLSYPFGRGSALSLGVVSRRGREQSVLAGFDFIQTDAGASAGSSGGPLVNTGGHVIGMITMASQSGNMGYAVPINVIKGMIPRLLTGEKVVWGWLGVRVSEVTLELADRLGLSPARGVLVNAVLPDQPAAKGKILPEDVILAVNEIAVDTPRELTRLVGGTEAGREVKLTIFRKGETFHRSVILAPKPKQDAGREG